MYGMNPDAPPAGGGAGTIGGWAALAAVGAGLWDSHQNRKASKENTDKTIEAQKAEAELAYQRQVAMWHQQNMYNSPAEQMKRFGAAGLNPHLIYGQGSSGNASGPPQYNPPNIQYRYAAPTYGAALQSAIPMLMQVGTWMQNMRLMEADYQAKTTNTEKTEQMIQFLMQRNPRQIQELDNRLSMYPYQKSMMATTADKAQVQVSDLLEQFRYKWGVPLETAQNQYTYSPKGGGAQGVQLLKLMAEERLKRAQADWFEPATIMRLVMGGILGMTKLGGIGGGIRKASQGPINRSAKRVKTFYQDGKRRSQVVDY